MNLRIRKVTEPDYGLITHFPAISAETTAIHGRIGRSVRVYLMDPYTEEDEVHCVGRSPLGAIVEQDIPWKDLRHIELSRGRREMTKRCWQGTKEEMLAMVEKLRENRVHETTDFHPDIDL